MNTNELKKLVYRQKPEAEVLHIQDETVTYIAWVRATGSNSNIKYNQPVTFNIPVEEIGSTRFKGKMDAKLLLRWLDEDTPSAESDNK